MPLVHDFFLRIFLSMVMDNCALRVGDVSDFLRSTKFENRHLEMQSLVSLAGPEATIATQHGCKQTPNHVVCIRAQLQ